MDMTKDALQYVVGLKKAEVIAINGENYTDREVHRVNRKLRAEPVKMSTLTSLVDYLKAGIDVTAEKMLVQVVSPEFVRVLSSLDEDRKREELVQVKASVPDFDYDRYIGQEEFLICLQAKFLQNEDRDLLLKFAGTVKNESITEYGDDGVSQKATIKTGVSMLKEALVPNPVLLCPFRTFVEAKQPESRFVFRMRQGKGSGVECALFEADGGAWKNEAMANIKEWLSLQLKDLPKYTVIS